MSNLEGPKGLNERVSVSIGLTKNLGDFNTLRADVSLSRDLKDGEKLSEAYSAIRRGLMAELDKTVSDALGSN